MSRNTVIKAEREVSEGIEPSDRQRAPGGGDIKSEDKQPGLAEALDELVNPETRGNPMSIHALDVEVDGQAGLRVGAPGLRDHR